MTQTTDAAGAFAEVFASLGAAWGLPEAACRLHAFAFVHGRPISPADLADGAGLTPTEAGEALGFLEEYELAWRDARGLVRVHDDPWDALLKGLDQRRARDLPDVRAALVDAKRGAAPGTVEARQIGKLVALIDDLTAVHAQAFRLPSSVLRGALGVSGRAARLLGGRR